ncbi:hypothetical protein ACL02S_23550 [Nocardia sp. 004]|uniref:hypothetical protein n=1 Tax=Nocardia sp. 004 TaxID=3385978 RepID=UPI0039A21CA7
MSWCRAPMRLRNLVVAEGETLWSIAMGTYPLHCLACRTEHLISKVRVAGWLKSGAPDLIPSKDAQCPACGTVGLWAVAQSADLTPVHQQKNDLEWPNEELWQTYGPTGVLPVGTLVRVPVLCGHAVFQRTDSGKQPQYCGLECPECAEADIRGPAAHHSKRTGRLYTKALQNWASEPGHELESGTAPVSEPGGETEAALTATITALTSAEVIAPAQRTAVSDSLANIPIVVAEEVPGGDSGSVGDEDDEQAAEDSPSGDGEPAARDKLTEMVAALSESARLAVAVRELIDGEASRFAMQMAELQQQVAAAQTRCEEAESAAADALAEAEDIRRAERALVEEAKQQEGQARAERDQALGAARVLESRLSTTESARDDLQRELDESRRRHQRELDALREGHQREMSALRQEHHAKVEQVYADAYEKAFEKVFGQRSVSPSSVEHSSTAPSSQSSGYRVGDGRSRAGTSGRRGRAAAVEDQRQRLMTAVEEDQVTLVVTRRGVRKWQIGGAAVDPQTTRLLGEQERQGVIVRDRDPRGETGEGEVFGVRRSGG